LYLYALVICLQGLSLFLHLTSRCEIKANGLQQKTGTKNMGPAYAETRHEKTIKCSAA
jgi:hypothetical protein